MLAGAFREYKSLPMGQNPPVFCTAGGCALSPARPSQRPNQLLKLALRCLRTPGLLFLFERLTLDSHIREATQEPNHDGSGGVSGSLVDGRRICNFDVSRAHATLHETVRGQNQDICDKPQNWPKHAIYASPCKQSSSSFKAQPSNVPQRASRSHAPERPQTRLSTATIQPGAWRACSCSSRRRATASAAPRKSGPRPSPRPRPGRASRARRPRPRPRPRLPLEGGCSMSAKSIAGPRPCSCVQWGCSPRGCAFRFGRPFLQGPLCDLVGSLRRELPGTGQPLLGPRGREQDATLCELRLAA